jgi:hypothetical protein
MKRTVVYFLVLLTAAFGVCGLVAWSTLLESRVDSAGRWGTGVGDSDTTDSAGTAQRRATLDYPTPVPIVLIVDDFTEQTGFKVVLCGKTFIMKLSLSGRNLTAGQFLIKLEQASAEASRPSHIVISRLLALLGMRKLAGTSAFSCGTGDALVWRRTPDGVEVWDSETYYHPVLCVTIGIAQPSKP